MRVVGKVWLPVEVEVDDDATKGEIERAICEEMLSALELPCDDEKLLERVADQFYVEVEEEEDDD